MRPLRIILLARAVVGEGMGRTLPSPPGSATIAGQPLSPWALHPPLFIHSHSPHPVPVAQGKRLALHPAAREAREPGMEGDGRRKGWRGLQGPHYSFPRPEICPRLQRCASLHFTQSIPRSWVIPKLLIRTASLPACHYLFVIQSMSALNFLFKAFLLLPFARASEAIEAGPNTSVSVLRRLYS